MTLQAKWDKLRFWNTNAFIWVFVNGRSYVINDAKRANVNNDKLNKNPFYEGTNIKRTIRNS